MCGFLALVTPQQQTASQQQAVTAALRCTRHSQTTPPVIWTAKNVILAVNQGSGPTAISTTHSASWGPQSDHHRYHLVGDILLHNHAELHQELTAAGLSVDPAHDAAIITAGFHLWGAEMVSKLRGMFSFALWDTDQNQLLVARDPFGIKPLVTTSSAAGVAFASDSAALSALIGDNSVSTAALQDYFVFQYVPEPEKIRRRMRTIESGHFMTITSTGETASTQYFEPVFHPQPHTTDADKNRLYERIATALTTAVTREVPDHPQPVGAFLSGGIDSTALASLISRQRPDLITFTTGFENASYSEIDVAAHTAEVLGVEHRTKLISEQEFTAAIPQLVWHLGDPVADPAIVPFFFATQLASREVAIAFSGEGADELFGGYNIYREPMSLRWATRLPRPLRRGLAALSRALPDGMRGKDMLRRGALDIAERFYGNARVFRQDELPALLPHFDTQRSFRTTTDPLYERTADWDPISRMQHIDLYTWMRGDILLQADRMSAAHNIQLRVPFLAHEVAQVAWEVPPELKITRTTSKFALRQALSSIVPPHVLDRRKLGFPVPIRHFLAGDSFSWARDIIASAHTDEFIRPTEALRLLEAHRRGDGDYSRRIWAVLIFMIWHGIFVSETIEPHQ